MKNLLVIFLAAIVVGQVSISCQQESKAKINKTELNQQELIKRGNYLVLTSGCHDCHSPKIFGPNGPEPDPDKLLMGHPADMPIEKFDTATAKSWILFNHHTTAAVGPWGVSFAANLTSDPTGIGNWTEEQFIIALREGKYKGMRNGRNMLPPMPWPLIGKMTDEDLKAIFAYLKTVPAVRNVPPAPISPLDLQEMNLAKK